MNIPAAKALEDFDEFLMLMDDQIDWLHAQANEHGIDLDGSAQSLDRLEHLYDTMAGSTRNDGGSGLRVVFARYLGEYVCTRHNGRWTLPLDDPRDVNFNMPVIVGHSSCAWLEFNPISAMRAYSLRPRPGLLRSIIDASVNPTPLDLSDLAEEGRAGPCPAAFRSGP